MTDPGRVFGGQNNWKGNAYEVAFAVCRCLELASSVLNGQIVTLQIQTDEPIDDLKIQNASTWEYYQIKDAQSITWTARRAS